MPTRSDELQYVHFESLERFLSDPFTFADGARLIIISSPAGFEMAPARRVKRVALNDNEADDEDAGEEAPNESDMGGGGRARQPTRHRGRKPADGAPSRQSRPGGGKPFSFPIVLPPYTRGRVTEDTRRVFGSCLLYVERVLVYVFNKKSEEPRGCGATVGGEASKFMFAGDSTVECPDAAARRAGGTFR